MRDKLTLFAFTCFLSAIICNVSAQKLLPESYNGPWNPAAPPCGWSWNLPSSDTPYGANFNGTDRFIRIDFQCQPVALSFAITPNNLPIGFAKEVRVYQLIGASWSQIPGGIYSWNGSVASPAGMSSSIPLNQALSLDLNASAIMFDMTVRENNSGNFGIANISISGGAGCGERTVYEDNFNNSCTNTFQGYTSCTNGEAPNNTKWNYQETDNGWSVAYEFTNNQMRIINSYNTDQSKGTTYMNKMLGGSFSPIGSDGVYGTYLTSNPNHINDEFTNNCEKLEWTFLLYLSHTPDGLSNGYERYGAAFVLGSTFNNLIFCNTSTRNRGYAVVFGS